MFQYPNKKHNNWVTVHFKDISKVRKVIAGSQNWNFIRYLKFYDSKHKQVGAFNPNSHICEEKEQVLAENEELYGVYGVKDKKNYFSSFGFIVKVKYL